VLFKVEPSDAGDTTSPNIAALSALEVLSDSGIGYNAVELEDIRAG
jgi:hypothetical protein